MRIQTVTVIVDRVQGVYRE